MKIIFAVAMVLFLVADVALKFITDARLRALERWHSKTEARRKHFLERLHKYG